MLQTLGTRAAWARTALCALPLVAGFVLPTVLLLRLLVVDREATALSPMTWRWIGNSLQVGVCAALVVVSLSLLLNARARLNREALALRIERLLSFGYAVPGAVLAIGVLWIETHGMPKAPDGHDERFVRDDPGAG